MVSGLSQAEEQENEFCGRNASKQSVASLSHIGTEECLGGSKKMRLPEKGEKSWPHLPTKLI